MTPTTPAPRLTPEQISAKIDASFEQMKAAFKDAVSACVTASAALESDLAEQLEAERRHREQVERSKAAYAAARAAALAAGATEQELAQDFHCPPLAQSEDKKAKARATARRTHSEQFRREAVLAARTNGNPLAQTAKDFGVGAKTLRKWVQDAERRAAPTASPLVLAAEAANGEA